MNLVVADTLRKQGLSYREIAERTGYTTSAVYKALNPGRAREYTRRNEARPERKQAKRAWERDPVNRGDCRICGGDMGKGWRRDGICRECRTLQGIENRATLVALYRRGMSPSEIAERMGLAYSTVVNTAKTLRHSGVDVPYAYGARRQTKERAAA